MSGLVILCNPIPAFAMLWKTCTNLYQHMSLFFYYSVAYILRTPKHASAIADLTRDKLSGQHMKHTTSWLLITGMALNPHLYYTWT